MERAAAKELLHIQGWLERVEDIIGRGRDAYLTNRHLADAVRRSTGLAEFAPTLDRCGTRCPRRGADPVRCTSAGPAPLVREHAHSTPSTPHSGRSRGGKPPAAGADHGHRSTTRLWAGTGTHLRVTTRRTNPAYPQVSVPFRVGTDDNAKHRMRLSGFGVQVPHGALVSGCEVLVVPVVTRRSG